MFIKIMIIHKARDKGNEVVYHLDMGYSPWSMNRGGILPKFSKKESKIANIWHKMAVFWDKNVLELSEIIFFVMHSLKDT